MKREQSGNFYQPKILILTANASTGELSDYLLQNGMRTHNSWECDQGDHEDDHSTHQTKDVDIVDLKHICQVACAREVDNTTQGIM